MSKRVAIIGMGISGLKTAHSLIQNSPKLFSSITFFEKNSELGGVLQHTCENNFLLEHGAQGVLLSRKSFSQCVKELGIQNDLLSAPKKQARYLIQNNKCVPISLKLLNLFSILKLIKVFVFKRHTPPKINETLYYYFLRHLGQKITDNFLIPFCFGIWGGGARKLLCRFCFPKFPELKWKQKSPTLTSFVKGMNFLPKALFADLEKLCQQNQVQLNVFFNTKVSYLEVVNNNFDIIIYAAQPWQDKNLSFGTSEQHKQATEILKEIPTHNIVVVGLGGKKKAPFFYKEGFGALANEISTDLLGILFVHSIYQEHAPKDGFLYRLLFGGDRCTNICSLQDDEFIENSKNHLKNLNLLSGDESITFQKVIRYNNYIPLATEYQDKVLCALWQLESLNPGLFFTGNYIKGVSVADCLEQARITADKVTNFIMEQE